MLGGRRRQRDRKSGGYVDDSQVRRPGVGPGAGLAGAVRQGFSRVNRARFAFGSLFAVADFVFRYGAFDGYGRATRGAAAGGAADDDGLAGRTVFAFFAGCAVRAFFARCAVGAVFTCRTLWTSGTRRACAPLAPAAPALPCSDLSTLGLICLVEVIKYFFAAYAPPVIANTNANPAITVAGLTRKRLRIAENIGYLSS